MRLIDADALKEQCFEFADDVPRSAMAFAQGQINCAPTIEAEPVRHGRWIDHMVRDWRCSECGERINKVRKVDGYCYDDKPNYCPNCGCRMDKENDNG